MINGGETNEHQRTRQGKVAPMQAFGLLPKLKPFPPATSTRSLSKHLQGHQSRGDHHSQATLSVEFSYSLLETETRSSLGALPSSLRG